MGKPYEVTLGATKLQLLMNDNIHLSKNTWNCKRHSNADFELHIILCGSCNVDVEDYRYAMQDHQAIIIAPGIFHLPAPSPGEFERLSMSFTPTDGPLKEKLYALITASRIYPITPEIDSVCQDIFRESASKEPFRDEMLRSLLTKLLICNFRILKLGSILESDPDCLPVSTYTDRIDDFFEIHMEKEVTAQVLAEELHLSRRQLARVLQQTYGMGFREKLIRTRMDRASWLLRNTRKPINEIAYEVGYASEAAFYSVFKDYFSETPAKHRTKYRTDLRCSKDL